MMSYQNTFLIFCPLWKIVSLPPPKLMSTLLSISLLLFLHCTLIFSAVADVAQFLMFHRHSPELAKHLGDDSFKPPETQEERVKDLVRMDHSRQHVIHHTLRLGGVTGLLKTLTESAAELPLRSAADEGKGQYFVSVNIGMPPQRFVLIVDTGSCLTWVMCKYRCADCNKEKGLQINKTFYPDRSSTFKTIPCRSQTCSEDLASSFSLMDCPHPMAPCKYDYRYMDGTTSQGFFANETVTVKIHKKRKARLRDVMIGCSETFTGNFHNIDGVLGMGFNIHSFAVKLAMQFGKKFSYCLVDHLSPTSLANLLSFGSLPYYFPNLQVTDLLITDINPFYYVNVTGISVGGKLLDVPLSTWQINRDGGGVILDSGSSLTYLNQPAYDLVMAALKAPLARFKKVDIEVLPMEHCFSDAGYSESIVPPLAVHFSDGAKLVPPVKSYVIDAALGVKCIGFAPGREVTVIGNIMQQNHFWEFDLFNGQLRFAPSTCDHII